MTARTVALALVTLLVVAAGAVQLLDPSFGEPRPPAVDFSEPPAAVAADSAARLEYVDYAYRIDVADDPAGPWEQLRVVWVDRDRHRFRSVGPNGEDGTAIFGNRAAVFARPSADSDWRIGYVPEAVFPAPSITQPFDVSVLEESTASVVRENATDLVVHVDQVALKAAPTTSGHSRLHIDKQRNLVEHAVVEYDVGGNQQEYARFRLVSTGTVVDRPDGLRVTPTELFWDLMGGPIFRLD